METDSISGQKLSIFRQLIWDYYSANRRDFPWRYVENSYYIVVSEIMLQQTQTFRVEPKFMAFIERFPTWQSLAEASWPDVLIAWQGLGYNSRAKRLHEIAKRIVIEFDGEVPAMPDILVTFPGIGINTAGSICAFAYNQPTVFAETNIRAVFIHHFFPGKEKISDKQILPLVKSTLDKTDPRSWYYALMDYGVFLKRQTGNPTRRSTHYARQSKFEGSNRQIRSMILKLLLSSRKMGKDELIASIDRERERVVRILQDLCDENLINCHESSVTLV